jgi:hypothetical protein
MTLRRANSYLPVHPIELESAWVRSEAQEKSECEHRVVKILEEYRHDACQARTMYEPWFGTRVTIFIMYSVIARHGMAHISKHGLTCLRSTAPSCKPLPRADVLGGPMAEWSSASMSWRHMNTPAWRRSASPRCSSSETSDCAWPPAEAERPLHRFGFYGMRSMIETPLLLTPVHTA